MLRKDFYPYEYRMIGRNTMKQLMIENVVGRGCASLFIDMQKLPVNDFKWAEDIWKLDQDFIESYNDGSDGEHFFEIDVQ